MEDCFGLDPSRPSICLGQVRSAVALGSLVQEETWDDLTIACRFLYIYRRIPIKHAGLIWYMLLLLCTQVMWGIATGQFIFISWIGRCFLLSLSRLVMRMKLMASSFGRNTLPRDRWTALLHQWAYWRRSGGDQHIFARMGHKFVKTSSPWTIQSTIQTNTVIFWLGNKHIIA